MKMHIVITGGTGFIGQNLIKELENQGFDILVLTRNIEKARKQFGNKVEYFGWDGRYSDQLKDCVDGAYAVINLAGENLASKRWTSTQKQIILESRINAAQTLVKTIKECRKKPKVFIQSSAVGFYPNNLELVLDEDSSNGNTFLGEVCRKWEESISDLKNISIRIIVIRTGVVLEKSGGALKKLTFPMKWFVGGHLGSGQQYVPWISMHDEIKAISYLLVNTDACGVYNLCSPELETMKTLVKKLGKAIKRPSWLHVPSFVLKFVFGLMAQEALLSSQKVYPKRLIESGFVFDYPKLSNALNKIFEKEIPKVMSMDKLMQSIDNIKE